MIFFFKTIQMFVMVRMGIDILLLLFAFKMEVDLKAK